MKQPIFSLGPLNVIILGSRETDYMKLMLTMSGDELLELWIARKKLECVIFFFRNYQYLDQTEPNLAPNLT